MIVDFTYNKFGSYVRERRLELGHGLREFAELVQISPTYLSLMERGKEGPPSDEILIRMADYLLCESSFLIEIAAKVPKKVVNMLHERPYLQDLVKHLYALDNEVAKGIVDGLLR